VRRTAKRYQEYDLSFDPSHDMFSLGICLFELLCNIKIINTSYNNLEYIINHNIKDSFHRKIISGLVTQDKSKRFTSRQVFSYLFDSKSPEKWIKPSVASEIKIS